MLLRWTSRPPAILSSLAGFAKRNMANTLRQYVGVRLPVFFSGVPSIEIRKFSGNGLRLDLAERHRHLHDVFVRLAHSDNAATADFHSRVAHRL